MKKERVKQEVNYDITSGDKIFEPVEFTGQNKISIQIEYSNFNANTSQIIVEHRLGNKFDSLDATATLIAADGTHTIFIGGLLTDTLRLKFVKNTLTTGVINTIHYLFD